LSVKAWFLHLTSGLPVIQEFVRSIHTSRRTGTLVFSVLVAPFY